jgi:hypothetical protein
MAVGTVSGANLDEQWQLIATATPSSSAATVFSSISGYKKLMITYQATIGTSADRLMMQFNGDSTAGNYGMTVGLYGNNSSVRSNDRFYLMSYADTSAYGYIVIADTDKTSPKWIERIGGYSTGYGNGVYFGTSAISSVSIVDDNGFVVTGTIKLYGIAA